MKKNLKTLFICILIPLLVGAVSGFISGDSMAIFSQLEKPPLSPPGWLFGVAWTILYILMGIASYLVITSSAPKESINKSMRLYFLQLGFNFFWSFWFFNLQLYFFSFLWLATLWFLIIFTIISFFKISKVSAYLLVPYLLWVTFAGYLNLGIALLN